MAKVIFLNGSSSSGKSTLAEKLQQLLDEPFQHLGLDQFRDGMPMRYRGLNSPPGTPGADGLNVVPYDVDGATETAIEFGAYGESMLRAMRRSIQAFTNYGMHVIIDDLLFKSEYLDDYVQLLDPKQTWFVGVRCELEVIEQREAARIGRFPGTAQAHYELVHAHGLDYDIEVDTGKLTPRQAAEVILTRLESPPSAFARRRAQL